jgi:hypothetical protein
MPHCFIVEAKPLECGSRAAAFAEPITTGIKAKAAALLPHSKGALWALIVQIICSIERRSTYAGI